MGKSFGYECKTCGGPAPTGVGHVTYAPGAEAASARLAMCGCGMSVDPAARDLVKTLRSRRAARDEDAALLMEGTMLLSAKFDADQVEAIIAAGKH